MRLLKIVVTCGPSFEPVDGARRLTNFSTGRLGTALANACAAQGWEVHCFRGEQATCPDPLRVHSVQPFSTNDDLARRLETLGTSVNIDAVLHAAALCDFKVARVEAGDGSTITSAKVSTRIGELRLVLAPTMKLLPRLAAWFPGARIVGWKYELEGHRENALAAARQQLREHGSAACVLNGAAYGPGFAFCTPGERFIHCPDPGALIRLMTAWLQT